MKMRGRPSAATIRALQAGKMPPLSEDALQGQIIDALGLHGYLTLIASRRRKVCLHCGKVSAGGDGASRGLPDVFVGHPVWPRGMWFGVEVKRLGPIRWSSDEQRELAESGRIVVVQSVEEAIRAAEGVGR